MVDCENEQQGEFVYLTDFTVNEEDGWSVVVNEATKRVLVTEDDPRSAEDTWSVVVNEEDDWCQVDLKEYLQQPPEAAPATPQTPDSQATTPGQAVPEEDLLFCEEYFHDITQPLTPEIRVNEQNTEEFDFVDLKCAKGNTKPLQDAEIFTSDDCYLAAQYGTPLQDDCWSDQVDEARELCSILGMQRCSKYFLLDDNVLHQRRKIDLLGNRERGKAAKKAWKCRNRYLY